MNDKQNFIKQEIGNWVSKNTEVVKVDDNTLEIATTQIDAYGDTVYCFAIDKGDYYKVSDDSHILFKLDPGETDIDLYRTAAQIAVGAGFIFDEENCEIFVEVDKENLAQAIIRLAQLQVAISYLG